MMSARLKEDPVIAPKVEGGCSDMMGVITLGCTISYGAESGSLCFPD